MSACRSLVRVAAPGGGHRVIELRGPPPQRPGPEWSLVRVTAAGICGSDLRGLADPGTPGELEPALGHEVVGVVAEAADGGPPVGARVVVNPLIPCAARALPPCPSCRHGWYGQCRSFWAPTVPWGKSLGFSADLGGGWGDYIAAHRTMLHLVPDELSDRTAVLAEPLSVAIAGLRMVRAAPVHRLVVVGGGTLGLLAAHAAASVVPGADRLLLVRHGFQADAATSLGVEAMRASPGSPVAALAARLGISTATLGRHAILIDGPGLVIDTGGGPESLAVAFATVGTGGTVLTLGNPESCPDLRPLWLKRITLVGHLEHAAACAGTLQPGEHPDSLSEAMRLLTASPGLGEVLVTHLLPLDAYPRALAIARDKPRYHAIKVVLEP